MGDYLELYQFLRKQQERYEYSDRAWIQQLDRVDQCTTFTYQTIEIDYCGQLSPFICEIGTFSQFCVCYKICLTKGITEVAILLL